MRFAVALSFILAAGTVALADGSGKLLVPRGTVVPVLVAQELRGSATGGNNGTNPVRLQVAQDVIVDHQLVAKAGDTVDADVTNATSVHSGISMHSGTVETVSVTDVANFCGDTLHVVGQFTAEGSVKSGIFGAKIKDAVIPKGTVLLVSTDRVEKKVCGQKTSANPAPVPANAVTPSAG
jgi:hypothetical protein